LHRGLVVADLLVEPDEHLAGFPSDHSALIVGSGEAADGVRSSKDVRDTNSVSEPILRRSSRAPRKPGTCIRVFRTSAR
jgi:hypothetical protein